MKGADGERSVWIERGTRGEGHEGRQELAEGTTTRRNTLQHLGRNCKNMAVIFKQGNRL
jgi:hypothetical protein